MINEIQAFIGEYRREIIIAIVIGLLLCSLSGYIVVHHLTPTTTNSHKRFWKDNKDVDSLLRSCYNP